MLKFSLSLQPLFLLSFGLFLQPYIHLPSILSSWVIHFSVIVILFKALSTTKPKHTLKSRNMLVLGMQGVFAYLLEGILYFWGCYFAFSFSILECFGVAIAAPALSPALLYPALDQLEKKWNLPLYRFKSMAAIENVMAILLFSFWYACIGSQESFAKAILLFLAAVFLGIAFASILKKCILYLPAKLIRLWLVIVFALFSCTIFALKLSLFLSALSFALFFARFSINTGAVQQKKQQIWHITGPLFYMCLGLQIPLSFISETQIYSFCLISLALILRFAVTAYLAQKYFASPTPVTNLLSAAFLPKLTLQLLFISQIIPLKLANENVIVSIICLAVILACFFGLLLQSLNDYFYRASCSYSGETGPS